MRLCAALLPLLALAQEQRAVRVTTRLVEVGVIAETKRGEPVLGLAREDFILFDGGREEKILFFAAGQQPAQPAAVEPPALDTFSNRVDQRGGAAAGVSVILFDGLNTRIPDQSYVRQQILAFLRRLQPSDRVALYALGRGVHVLQDFTRDSRALIDALETYRGELRQEPAESLPDDLAGVVRFSSWLEELRTNLIDHYNQDRALRTIRSLVAIANHVERLPGRKNLIWVSGSFPVWIGRDSVPLPARPVTGTQSFWPEIERAARALNNANLAIYPVDARGLMAPVEYSPERASISRDATILYGSGFQTMDILAGRTGGRTFYNNNDLVQALRRAADDARYTATLAYQPSHNEWNGKFREIELQVKRPDVRLRHRRGYFAQPEEPAEAWYREGVLGAAMWSPVDATRLGLTVRVIPRTERTLDLEVQVDPRDILLEPKEGHWEAALDVWLVQLGRKDRHLKTQSHLANLRLDGPAFRRAMQSQSLALMERLELDKDTLLLRILVRDIAGGSLGSVTIPVSRVQRRPGS
jgi:VWFA-related protein